MHKSGFVNIIGNPNVGKSTLMNQLVGEKLSIITSKAQTTRHRIMGVVSGEDFQIVYSDTPGILKPSYKLQESMMKFVTGALTDADVILFVTDTVEESERAAEILTKLKKTSIPVIVVINKVEFGRQEVVPLADGMRFARIVAVDFNVGIVPARLIVRGEETADGFFRGDPSEEPFGASGGAAGHVLEIPALRFVEHDMGQNAQPEHFVAFEQRIGDVGDPR